MRIFKYSDLADQFTLGNITNQVLVFKFLDQYNDLLEGNYLLAPANEYDSSDIGPTLRENALASTSEFRRSWLACCFCRGYDNQTMWANYGTYGQEHNAGVCLELDSERLPAFLKAPIPITYNDGPRYIMRDNKVYRLEMGATKNKSWSGEDEVRYLVEKHLFENPKNFAHGPQEQELVQSLIDQPARHIRDAGFTINYPLEAVKGIYFGANTKEEHITALKTWASEKKIPAYKIVADQINSILVRVRLFPPGTL